MQQEEQQPQSLDYVAASSIPLNMLSFGEKIGLIMAALPLVTLLIYHLAVALSPWTLDELCRSADECTPISATATKLTDIGALLHFAAFFASPLLGLAAFVLGLRALQRHRTLAATVAGVMVVCCIISFFLGGSSALSLAGF